MKILEFSINEGTRYQIEVGIIYCGEDLSVTICGGTHYHIGAVALGIPRESLDASKTEKSSSVSVICATGHKDDEVARWVADYLASKLDCKVSVSVGIHIDNATEDEIKHLVESSQSICQEILNKI